jgi:hypothetical protein
MHRMGDRMRVVVLLPPAGDHYTPRRLRIARESPLREQPNRLGQQLVLDRVQGGHDVVPIPSAR